MEQETTPAPTLMNHALRWGMITAAISIIMTMLMYAIDYTIMVQLKVLFIMLAIYLGVVIYAGIDYRKAIGGFLAYGKAWQHGFLILAISGFIATLFSLVLYNVIDPDLPEKLVDASMENTRAIMERFGTPEDAVEDALEKARESTADRFTIGGILLGYVQIAIFSAIMALISALVVRKNQPEMI